MVLTMYDFEKPIVEIEQRIEEIKNLPKDKDGEDKKHLLLELEEELLQKKKEIYENLTAWQRVQIARHIERPHFLDYVKMLFTDFIELHGDRYFSDDPAIVTGFAQFDDMAVCLIGQQKGKDTKENLKRNFGMAHPEGYRKAMRVMRIAEKFSLPILVFVDTPGAYPGIGAEERGQAEAIARNIRDMSAVKVPILIIIIGEGASGGALGIGCGDKILMMENAWYCVISPEGCASILWRDRAMAPQSSEALKLTANDLIKLGVIDDIIPEPLGGAHRDPQIAANNVKEYIKKYLPALMAKKTATLLKERYEKYRSMGKFIEK